MPAFRCKCVYDCVLQRQSVKRIREVVQASKQRDWKIMPKHSKVKSKSSAQLYRRRKEVQHSQTNIYNNCMPNRWPYMDEAGVAGMGKQTLHRSLQMSIAPT